MYTNFYLDLNYFHRSLRCTFFLVLYYNNKNKFMVWTIFNLFCKTARGEIMTFASEYHNTEMSIKRF